MRLATLTEGRVIVPRFPVRVDVGNDDQPARVRRPCEGGDAPFHLAQTASLAPCRRINQSCLRFLSSRLRNAILEPSGENIGMPSLGPAVNAAGSPPEADTIMICERDSPFPPLSLRSTNGRRPPVLHPGTSPDRTRRRSRTQAPAQSDWSPHPPYVPLSPYEEPCTTVVPAQAGTGA